MFKDIECPILSIAENDETCTLLLNVHTGERTEKENEMISEAINKLIDLLPDVEEESHTFGDFIAPLVFDAIFKSVMEHESKEHENEAPKQHQFKVGDRVRFKTWEQMEKEYGLDEYGEIRTTTIFTECMKHLCGTFATIKTIEGNEVILSDFSSQGMTCFNFSIDMIEPSPYFCGKVVCVDDKGGSFTKGKVYAVEDGVIIGDINTFCKIRSLKNMNETMESKFIEVKDE